MDSESVRLPQPLFVGALRQLGAEEYAVILEQAVARLPKGLSLNDAYSLLWEQSDGLGLEDLEIALVGCSIRLVDLLELYLVQHLDDFTDFIK